MPLLYVVHQALTRAPALEEWIQEAWEVLGPELTDDRWQLVKIQASEHNSFDARIVHARVAATMGPVAVVGSIKASSVAELRDKLMLSRTVVTCVNPIESTDVYDCMRRAVDAHASGVPHLSKRLVAALFVLRKLEKRNCWGGEALNKAYLYADELCHGGMPPELFSIAHEVANFLRIKGFLGSKPSNRRLKYCLNTEFRSEILMLIEERRIADEKMRKYLLGGNDTVSARILDKYFGEFT